MDIGLIIDGRSLRPDDGRAAGPALWKQPLPRSENRRRMVGNRCDHVLDRVVEKLHGQWRDVGAGQEQRDVHFVDRHDETGGSPLRWAHAGSAAG